MKATTYGVVQIDEVTIAPGSPLDGLALMSPYVWKDGETYRLMVRGSLIRWGRTIRPG